MEKAESKRSEKACLTCAPTGTPGECWSIELINPKDGQCFKTLVAGYNRRGKLVVKETMEKYMVTLGEKKPNPVSS